MKNEGADGSLYASCWGVVHDKGAWWVVRVFFAGGDWVQVFRVGFQRGLGITPGQAQTRGGSRDAGTLFAYRVVYRLGSGRFNDSHQKEPTHETT